MTNNSPELSRQAFDRVWQSETPLMVALPAGEFMMGENGDDKYANDTERPAHLVRIGAFSLGRFPVTVDQFRRFQSNHAPSDEGTLPVTGVSWNQACAYCDWLTRTTGRPFRLPSEAEWEYACRAGSRGLFSFGNEISPVFANYYYDDCGARVGAGSRVPVGSHPPNAFGLYDLHGNVCEWVEDSWHANYIGAPDEGRAWVEPEDSRRLVRGGAWDYLPRLLRSAWRDWHLADQRTDNIGFRVATNDSAIQPSGHP